MKKKELPIVTGVSNRHVHLSREDVETLFGNDYQLTPIKDLGQPNQFACKETVIIVGPKGAIEGVRVLGPERKETQVEISLTDVFKIGVMPPVRDSGDLEGTPGITIVGPKG
ncbi:MAG: PduL/EutD family phosphate acyltransferase, partial [Fervidobacterium sp.]